MSKVEIARRATETRKRNGTKCLGGLSWNCKGDIELGKDVKK
jgi:hypothetical protein